MKKTIKQERNQKEYLNAYKQGYANAQNEIIEFLLDCVNNTDSVRKKLKKKIAEIRRLQSKSQEAKE